MTSRSETWWITYAKALIFLSPPLGLFGALMIFVIPKIKQICVDAGYDGYAVFGPMDFFAQRSALLVAIVIVLIFALERWFPAWSKYRKVAVGLSVFVINSAVLLGLSATILILAIAAPALILK